MVDSSQRNQQRSRPRRRTNRSKPQPVYVTDKIPASLQDKDLRSVTYVVYDLETTGGNPDKNGITEVCALKVMDLQVVDRFYTLVNPMIPIPPIVRKMTGITNKMVQDAPTIEEVMPKLSAFIGDAVLVSHNAIGDLRFLRHFSDKICGRPLKNFFLCTHLLVEKLFPQTPDKSLTGIGRYFDCTMGKMHRADADADLTYEVFLKMLGGLKGLNKSTLGEAIRFQGDYESALRLGWRIDESKLRRLPSCPGMFELFDQKGKVTFLSSAMNLRREIEKLACLDQVPRSILRSVVQSVDIKVTPTKTVFEALMSESKAFSRHCKLQDPFQLHQRQIHTLNFAWVENRRQCRIYIGAIQADSFAFWGPIRDRKAMQRYLAEIAEVLGMDYTKKGMMVPPEMVNSLLSLLAPEQPAEPTVWALWVYIDRFRRRWFADPKWSLKLSAVEKIQAPERLKPLHELSGFVLLEKGAEYSAYRCSQGRPDPQISATLDAELVQDTDSLMKTLSIKKRIKSSKKSQRNSLDLEQSLQVNALLWWMFSGTHKREGRFLAVEE